MNEGIGIFGIAQVVTGKGGVVERRAPGGIMGVEGGVQARPELEVAGFLVHQKDRALLDRKMEPRLAVGNTSGQIDGKVGLFSAGIANEDVETGLSEDAGDDPIEDRRVMHAIFGFIKDAIFLGAVDGCFGGLVHVLDHAVIEGAGGFGEGLPAGEAICFGHVLDGHNAVHPFRRYPFWQGNGDVAGLDADSDDPGGFRARRVGNLRFGRLIVIVGWIEFGHGEPPVGVR